MGETLTDDARRLQNLRRRVRKVRNFPTDTCPASRHLHMIAEALAAGKPYHGCDWQGWDREDQRWIAETMLATLESLWTLRRERSANPCQ